MNELIVWHSVPSLTSLSASLLKKQRLVSAGVHLKTADSASAAQSNAFIPPHEDGTWRWWFRVSLANEERLVSARLLRVLLRGN